MHCGKTLIPPLLPTYAQTRGGPDIQVRSRQKRQITIHAQKN